MKSQFNYLAFAVAAAATAQHTYKLSSTPGTPFWIARRVASRVPLAVGQQLASPHQSYAPAIKLVVPMEEGLDRVTRAPIDAMNEYDGFALVVPVRHGRCASEVGLTDYVQPPTNMNDVLCVANMFMGADFRPVPGNAHSDIWRMIGTVFGGWANSFGCIGETEEIGGLILSQM
jgi:hypothetical protein